MPKTKPPSKVHTAHLHHQTKINNAHMDKVKIKRVKRNKKTVTAKEKILAGLGVGGSLLGGIAGVAPKANQTNIVSTTGNEQQSGTSKVKSVLNKIFGATFGAGVAKADEGSGFIQGEQMSGADLNNQPGGGNYDPGTTYYYSENSGTWIPSGDLANRKLRVMQPPEMKAALEAVKAPDLA
jgi:hypothetical protein